MNLGERHVVVSPNDGTTIGSWEETDDRAIASKLASLADAERRLTADLALRSHVLQAIQERMLACRDALAGLIVEECGKTLEEANGEVEYAASFLAYCRSRLASFPFYEHRDNAREICEVPIGAALLIPPYNDPLAGITRKIAPAIAAGCPVLVKPSPLGVLCARALEAALPDTVLPFVQFVYVNDAERPRRLILAPEIAIVSFTGSTTTGRAIAQTAATRPIPTILELSGNCPLVVLADADIDRAIEDLLKRRIRAAGQACSAINRVLVHFHLYPQLINQLADLVSSVACGPSNDPRADFGPVRTRELEKRLVRLVEQSSAVGDGVLARGTVVQTGKAGHFFPLTAIESRAKVGVLDREESFGPLFSVRPFREPEEALANLAGNKQRLAVYVYGRQTAPFVERLSPLKFGSLGLNTTQIQGADAPTGGFAYAGFGREGGDWGIRGFLASVNIRRSP